LDKAQPNFSFFHAVAGILLVCCWAEDLVVMIAPK
jgi:hypothetical protein